MTKALAIEHGCNNVHSPVMCTPESLVPEGFGVTRSRWASIDRS